MTKEQAFAGHQIYSGTVTLVTGHKEQSRWSILLELVLYCLACYYVADPETIGNKIREKFQWLRHQRQAAQNSPSTNGHTPPR